MKKSKDLVLETNEELKRQNKEIQKEHEALSGEREALLWEHQRLTNSHEMQKVINSHLEYDLAEIEIEKTSLTKENNELRDTVRRQLENLEELQREAKELRNAFNGSHPSYAYSLPIQQSTGAVTFDIYSPYGQMFVKDDAETQWPANHQDPSPYGMTNQPEAFQNKPYQDRLGGC